MLIRDDNPTEAVEASYLGTIVIDIRGLLFHNTFGSSGDILMRRILFGKPVLVFTHGFYWVATYRGEYALIGDLSAIALGTSPEPRWAGVKTT